MTLISSRSSVSARSFGHLQSLNGEYWFISASANRGGENSLVTLSDRAIYYVSASTTDSTLSKISAYGEGSWQRKFTEADTFRSWCLTADSADNLYMGGYVFYDTSTDRYAVLGKYLPDGTAVWEKYDTTDGLEILNIGMDSSDNLYVLLSKTSGSPDTAAIVKLSASTGSSIWGKKISNLYNGDDSRMAVSPDGSTYLSILWHPDGYESTSKFDSSGNLLWQKDIFGDVYSDYDNNAYVVRNNAITRLDSDGDTAWKIQVSGLSIQNIRFDSDNNVYVSGDVSETDLGYLAKFNSSGTLQWQRNLYVNRVSNNTKTPFTSVVGCDNYGGIYVAGGAGLIKLPSDGSKTQSSRFVTDSVAYTLVYTPSSYTHTLTGSEANGDITVAVTSESYTAVDFDFNTQERSNSITNYLYI